MVSLLSVSAFSSDESCVEKTGCELKKCELGVQIIAAEKAKNKRQVVGLNKALDAINRDCSEATIKEHHSAKIMEKEKEITARTKDLEGAQASGKKDKIAKRIKKLEEAKDELLKLKAEK